MMMRHSNLSTKVLRVLLVLGFALSLAPIAEAQEQSPSSEAAAQDSGTSTDLYVMLGSDFDRPGWLMKANYNIGVGHTFGFLHKDPIGDELTFAYTYENAGAGFWHSQFDSGTEAIGIMKNFNLPTTKRVTAYTWVQVGITSFTGNPGVQNRFYDGESLGAIIHFDKHSSIWVQETFNKIVTVPWYLTTSVGYTWSW